MGAEIFRIFLQHVVVNVYKISNHSEGSCFCSVKWYGMPPLSITYKFISEFKSNVFIFQNPGNHHNSYFFAPVFIIEILVDSGPYFEKYVAELDKLVPITFLVCPCNVYQLQT